MDLLIYVLVVWFAFYIVNHSLILEKLRNAAIPALPQWLQTLVQCAICFSFWITVALSLFTGFTMAVFAAPPCILFVDLAYRKLTEDKNKNDQPPILK